MRISDWSSDVCSSDLPEATGSIGAQPFLLASLILDRPIRAVELALAVQRLAEKHDALRLRWMHDDQANHLEIAAYVGQLPIRMEIGRASCRERVCQDV